MPPSRYRAALNVSRKKPRGSRNTSGSTITTPARSVSRNFKGHLSNLYPCPRTVRKWRGSSAFTSSLTRSDRTKLSTVRGVPSYSAPQQLAQPEGLAQVIVRAELEPEDLVALHAFGGEHQDRGVRPLPARFLEHLEAVPHRQHDVEHDQVDVGFQRHPQPGLAVLRDAHLVAVLAQVQAQAQGDRAIVFDDQDASHHAAGRITRKVRPSPILLSSSMRPPCSSTIFLAMASPRPVPSVWRESRLSPR